VLEPDSATEVVAKTADALRQEDVRLVGNEDEMHQPSAMQLAEGRLGQMGLAL
jgi:hypothetical protein